MSIHSYTKDTTKSGKHYRTHFVIEDANIALVNSLRRASMSMVPTVAFDSTWQDDKLYRSIVFERNTTALHNEWLADRIALCPIRMTGNKELAIQTTWNTAINKREFVFSRPETVPIFQISLKNDKSTAGRLDPYGYIKMTTDDFEVVSNDLENKVVHRLQRFIPHDPFTDRPIVLNKLKNNINEEAGEEVQCICKPRVGTGRIHARHDPCGTVTYEFVVTKNEDEIRRVFKERIEWINSEHKKVGESGGTALPPLTKEEVAAEQRSFELLDKARVYERKPDGTAKAVKMSVESIGFLEPDQIIYDALRALELAIQDCLSAIQLTREPSISYTTNTDKLEVTEIRGSAFGVYIHLKNEDHTLGNLIADYTKRLFAKGSPSDGFGKEIELFNKVAYSMPHPLEQEVVIAYDFWLLSMDSAESTKNQLLETVISSFYGEVFGLPLESKASELTPMEMVRIVALLSFIRVCNVIKQDIGRLLLNWERLTTITEPTFKIADEKDWLFRNNNNIALKGERMEIKTAQAVAKKTRRKQ